MTKLPTWKYADDNSWLRSHYYWYNEEGQVVGEMLTDRRNYFLVLFWILISGLLFWWQISLHGPIRWLVVLLAIVLLLVQMLRSYVIFMIEGSNASQRRTFKQSR